MYLCISASIVYKREYKGQTQVVTTREVDYCLHPLLMFDTAKQNGLYRSTIVLQCSTVSKWEHLYVLIIAAP